MKTGPACADPVSSCNCVAPHHFFMQHAAASLQQAPPSLQHALPSSQHSAQSFPSQHAHSVHAHPSLHFSAQQQHAPFISFIPDSVVQHVEAHPQQNMSAAHAAVQMVVVIEMYS